MGAIDLRGGKARRVGSEGALDECSEHLNCSGVIPGGLCKTTVVKNYDYD